MSHSAERGSGARRHAGIGAIKVFVAVVVIAGLAGGGWAIMGSGNDEAQDTPDIFRTATMTFQVTAMGNGELRAKNQTS